MARINYEQERAFTGVVAFIALIGCLFGSWLAFGVLCAMIVDYHLIAFLELLDTRWERK